MLVYGDPQFTTRLPSFLFRFRQLAQAYSAASLDHARALLIQAGQLEQAILDSAEKTNTPDSHACTLAGALCDAAALRFVSEWAPVSVEAGSILPQTAELNGRFAAALTGLARLNDLELTVKIPEGYEFYTLYPESYCLSAIRWARDHANASQRNVFVLGLRSIGTSLSAAVSAVLECLGWRVQRRCVRPVGHPFSRNLQLTDIAPFLNAEPLGIVVDEGPGLSGSSIIAAARALADSGIRDITFFPGHNGSPGAAASEATRRVWDSTPKYTIAFEDLRWNGRDIYHVLTDRTAQLLGCPVEDVAVQDLSAGKWRALCYDDESLWPAVVPAFERTKFLCRSRGGETVLWKFGGLGCAGGTEENPNTPLAASGMLVPHLDTHLGFCCYRWLNGRRLTAADAAIPGILAQLGPYLLHSRRPPPDPAEHASSVARLSEMLHVNASELLGKAPAERTRPFAEAAAQMLPSFSYGDGRMGPWEWVFSPAGVLGKTDYQGHTRDHTIVGEQSLLWDIAGAQIEWGLDAAQSESLLEPLRPYLKPNESDVLPFYQMAYTAFRAGLMSFAAGQAEGNASVRIQSAALFYKRRLRSLLPGPSRKRVARIR